MPIVSCYACQQKFSVDFGGRYQCPHCSQTQDVDTLGATHAPTEASHAALGASRVPFEVRDNPQAPVGFLPALFATLMLVVKEPSNFFRGMAREEYSGAAFLYGVLLGSVSSFIGQLTLWPLVNRMVALMPAIEGVDLSKIQPSGFGLLTNLIMAPLSVAIQILVSAGIAHLSLMIFRAANGSFTSTLKVYSYSQTPMVLQMIPGIGILAGWIWAFSLNVIGLSEVHNASRGRVTWALVAPGLFCCLCCGALIFVGAGSLLNWSGRF